MSTYQEFLSYHINEKNHWWYVGRRNILRKFLNLIEFKNQKSVLEIGIGAGGNLIYLFNEFKERFGLEIDENALNFAKKNLTEGINLKQGDANLLNSYQYNVDCIALCDVLYHEKILSCEEVINSCFNKLNQNGYLLITDGAFNFLKGNHSHNVGHGRRFTKKELNTLLEKHNFKIVNSSYWGFLLFFLLFIKRKIIEPLFSKNNSEFKSDLAQTPIIDNILGFSLKIESWLLQFCNIPLGASIVILAKKVG
jgi:SAM-dependent methyltransferase